MTTRRSKFAIAGALALAAACATACASAGPTVDGNTNLGTLNGAKIEISSEGGFAALSITQRVEHDTRVFGLAQRRLCGTTCPTPSDTANGTLSPATTDSVFNIVLEQARSLANDDYGTTRNGADMMTYTIRLTSNDRVKTIRGDDGTLPDAARRIMSTVREAILAARNK